MRPYMSDQEIRERYRKMEGCEIGFRYWQT